MTYNFKTFYLALNRLESLWKHYDFRHRHGAPMCDREYEKEIMIKRKLAEQLEYLNNLIRFYELEKEEIV